jgi:hypothetical protein
MLVITVALVGLAYLVYPLRWYWLLTFGAVLFWPVSCFIERRPLGTFALRKFFRE